MILVDTSIWVDHLRAGDPALAALLQSGLVLGHPFVLGEMALGHLRQREVVLDAMRDLPQAVVAEDGEVLLLIARHGLAGSGIGYVDAHLLCAVKLTPDARLFTRDKRAAAAAAKLSVGYAGNSIPS